MAKRELSSTLRNLKFMQRAVQKEEKSEKEEEIKADGSFPSSRIHKKCQVIMEGDPHPGAIKGRMSFRSFNPNIDKLNEDATKPEASTTFSENQSGSMSDRENGSTDDGSGSSKPQSFKNDANGDLKRKQAEVASGARRPNKTQKSIQQADQQSSPAPSNSRKSHKQPKREKLDWNVLRPPKAQSKRE